MGAVSNLLSFKEHWEMPTLVLVDIHNDHPPGPESDLERKVFLAALEKCRAALACARQQGFPVAFVRHMSPPRSFLATRVYPSWIGDIRPLCSDMVFERASPSCYASNEFAQMASNCGELVLAGLFGETACLSTLVEGHGRGHAFIYLSDASVSRGRSGISSQQMHQSVTAISSIYSEIFSTDAWTEAVKQKIGTVG